MNQFLESPDDGAVMEVDIEILAQGIPQSLAHDIFPLSRLERSQNFVESGEKRAHLPFPAWQSLEPVRDVLQDELFRRRVLRPQAIDKLLEFGGRQIRVQKGDFRFKMEL